MNIAKNLTKRTNLLILLNCILLLCLIFIYIPKRSIQKINTTLLHHSEINNITEIILTVPNKSLPLNFTELKLIKKNSDFVYKTEYSDFKIKQTLIDNLFKTLTTKKDFIFITDKISQYANFGLSKNDAIKMQLLRNDKTIAGEFIFGKKDTLGTSIYIQPDARTKIFKMLDTISPFLTLNTNFWINLQIYKTKFEKNSIQEIHKNNLRTTRSSQNDERFLALETFLSQFSCIDIFPTMPITSPQTEYTEFVLGNNEGLILGTTPLENGDYILFEDNSKTAFVISGYTKNRITNLCKF